MEGEIGLIVEATRQASRFLIRDFFELENLQTLSRNTLSYSQRSCMKILQVLQERLGKYFKTIIFDNKDLQNLNFTDTAILVETIDGFANLTRSLPFFSIMITILKIKNDQVIAEKSVMNFPALGEIYYVEKGRGAWLERYNTNLPGALRLRVSGVDNIENAIGTTNIDTSKIAKLVPNLRIYDSYTYSLAQLIAGKLDIAIIKPNEIANLGCKLFIEEAVGAFYENNKTIIASNIPLRDKIKHIIDSI
ncbi:MAG: hypothetical protein EKK61_02830 [Rickettsiales bacterium]|nr:MAG: hypothetical protein EKK61_02830 [Rickettsiales bacterium]